MSRIAIIGSGAWGTALAISLAQRGTTKIPRGATRSLCGRIPRQSQRPLRNIARTTRIFPVMSFPTL